MEHHKSSKMMKIVVLVILGVSLVANILLIWHPWKEPVIQLGADEQVYRDSISSLKKERLELDRHIDSLNGVNDSLTLLKQTEIIKYHAKVKFIYSADPTELDSIIRQLAGLPSRNP